MATKHYTELSNTYSTGGVPPAAEYDGMVSILDTQAEGALEGVGAGIISGGVVSGGAGLSVSVAALQAVIASTYGAVYGLSTGASTVTNLNDNSTLYIWAGCIWDPGGDDTRETGWLEIFASPSATGVADAILLASVVTAAGAVTTVTDIRSLVPAQQALALADGFAAQIAAVEAAVGTEYFGDTPPASSLNARVDNLELGGTGGGGAGTFYWGAAKRSLGEDTTIEQMTDTKIAAAIAAIPATVGGATLILTDWDVDANNSAQGWLDEIARVNPNIGDGMSDVALIVPGRKGRALVDFGHTDLFDDWGADVA
jgi:hypothetical protein